MRSPREVTRVAVEAIRQPHTCRRARHWVAEQWRRTWNWVRPRMLLVVTLVLLIAVGLVIGVTELLSQLVFGRFAVGGLPKAPADITQLDLVKVALPTAAGLGGVVALVVAYRRQAQLEREVFNDRYAGASQQLGDPEPTVRLAGTYAMASLADEWKLQRQQCIDVLCAYLRLPWADETGELEPGITVTECSWVTDAGEQRRVTKTLPGQPGRGGEREVRRTLIRVIARHLQKEVDSSWSSCSFDFLGASLPDASFGQASFNGKLTRFAEVTFTGENTWFDEAVFSGGKTRFKGATFTGTNTSFKGAEFSGEDVLFDGAHFSGRNTTFEGATFTAGNTSFADTAFSGHVPEEVLPFRNAQ